MIIDTILCFALLIVVLAVAIISFWKLPKLVDIALIMVTMMTIPMALDDDVDLGMVGLAIILLTFIIEMASVMRHK